MKKCIIYLIFMIINLNIFKINKIIRMKHTFVADTKYVNCF